MKDSMLRNLFAYAVESMYLTYGDMYRDNDGKYLVETAKKLRNNEPVRVSAIMVDGREVLPAICDTFAMFWQRTFMGIREHDYDEMFNIIFAKNEDV